VARYDPSAPSPRFAELPPRLQPRTHMKSPRWSGRTGTPPDRCLTGGLPEFAGGMTQASRRKEVVPARELPVSIATIGSFRTEGAFVGDARRRGCGCRP